MSPRATFYIAGCCYYTLRWRHNERDVVSNHRRLNGLFNCGPKKTVKLRAKGQWRWKCFHLMTSPLSVLLLPSQYLRGRSYTTLYHQKMMSSSGKMLAYCELFPQEKIQVKYYLFIQENAYANIYKMEDILFCPHSVVNTYGDKLTRYWG